MIVVILAGGFGTRLSEETQIKPKPMIEIGGKPIIWHIMKMYSSYGINEFVVCLGYKGYIIKEYFANYHLHMSNLTIDMRNNEQTIHSNHAEPWKITLVDTGIETATGGRLKRVQKYIDPDEPFYLTYGDGVSDVPLDQLMKFHQSHSKKVTLTAIHPPERFGVLDFHDSDTLKDFKEKPDGKESYINGGFFVVSPQVLDRIEGDHTVWERDTLKELAQEREVKAFKHHGFWQCMDTMRDKRLLEELWDNKIAPWKRWDS
jgi:glucose-1-phosphate cytidylyltransferase